MKNAQDAVKEIKEWPVQKYLIENEDGSIEFSDNKPGRVVCTKGEFMEARDSRKTMADAVRELNGNLDNADCHLCEPRMTDEVVFAMNMRTQWKVWGVGWVGKRAGWYSVGTRAQFEAEAKRQALETLEGFTAYAQPGFSGDPNDCAFKDEWLPPIGTKAICAHDGEAHLIVAHDLLSDEPMALTVDESGYWGAMSHHWSPLKSDRERWVEAARDEGFPLWVAGLMYDKIKSGELPIPEAK